MSFKQSISTNNVFNGCGYQFYLKKIASYPEEPDDKPQYGLSGTMVHEYIEKFYVKQIHKSTPESQQKWLIENKKLFKQEWMTNNISRLNVEQYWKCVENGVKSDFVPTHTEEFISITTNDYEFVAKIDARNSDKWILDYKTSNFSVDKVKDYFEQLIGYAFAVYTKHKIIPEKLVVMFLKQDPTSKTFTHELTFNPNKDIPKPNTFTLDDLKKFEEGLIENQKQHEQRYKNYNWDKNFNHCFFCNYKKLCYSSNQGDFKVEMINKDNTIYLRQYKDENSPQTKYFPEPLLNKIDEKLTYYLPEDNLYFAIKAYKEKTGKDWDGSFHLFNKHQVCFQTGFKDRVKEILDHYARYTRTRLLIKETDLRTPLPKGKIPICWKLNFPHPLYQYQIEAVYHAIKNEVGIIKLPTGSGKSIIAAEILRKLNTASLYVIDNKDLLEQTKEDYEELLGIEVGTITEGEFNPKKITVSTIQTITRCKNPQIKEEIKKYLAHVNCVILDECHIIAADSFKYLNTHLINCRYTIATSATPYRIDGSDLLLEERAGRIIYEKTSQELEEQGLFKRPKVEFYKVPALEELGTVTKEINGVEVEVPATWRDNYDQSIIFNETRNKIIVGLINQHQGKQILITASTHEHLKWLKELIPQAELVHGKTPKDKRKDIIDKFKKGEHKILISQIKLLFKGLNIHKLEVLINAAGHKSEISTTQLIGRLLRKHPEGKEKLYIDFFDLGTEYERATERYTTLKKDLQYEVNVIDKTQDE